MVMVFRGDVGTGDGLGPRARRTRLENESDSPLIIVVGKHPEIFTRAQLLVYEHIPARDGVILFPDNFMVLCNEEDEATSEYDYLTGHAFVGKNWRKPETWTFLDLYLLISNERLVFRVLDDHKVIMVPAMTRPGYGDVQQRLGQKRDREGWEKKKRHEILHAVATYLDLAGHGSLLKGPSLPDKAKLSVGYDGRRITFEIINGNNKGCYHDTSNSAEQIFLDGINKKVMDMLREDDTLDEGDPKVIQGLSLMIRRFISFEEKIIIKNVTLVSS